MPRQVIYRRGFITRALFESVGKYNVLNFDTVDFFGGVFLVRPKKNPRFSESGKISSYFPGEKNSPKNVSKKSLIVCNPNTFTAHL